MRPGSRILSKCFVVVLLLAVMEFCSATTTAQSNDVKTRSTTPIPSTANRVANVLVLESEAITLRRITIGPNSTGHPYRHPGGWIIFLSNYSFQITLPLISELEAEFKVGDLIPVPRGEYVLQNPSSKPFEFLSIEINH